MSPVQPLHGSEHFVFMVVFVLVGLPKSPQKQQTNNSDLCLLSSLSMGLNFILFLCFLFWLVCQKVLKNHTKKFTPMSPVQPLHGSEHFFVLVGLPKSVQTQKTKVQTYVSCPASPWV